MSLPEPVAPGTVFAGQFRVVRMFAQGGMGTVYQVEQLGTGHPRALKVMHPQLASDPRARDRFVQEAQAAARIESEHVVQVVSAGVDPTLSTPWIAMELLQGEDLAAAMARRGRFPPAEVLEVFRQLGHALSAAHRAGIVHRDLKPENIFVANARRSDASFTVKVLDFGIAKWIQEHRPAGNTTIVGSPPWMAPEQLDARGVISPAADQWSLGLIAFAMLVGQPYWLAANPQRFSFPQLLVEVGSAAYVPASQRAQELGAPSVIPPGFDGWLARTLMRDPSQRWRDVTEQVTALATVLQAASQQASPVGATVAIPMAQLPVDIAAGLGGNLGASVAGHGGANPAGNLGGTMAIPSMATPLQGSFPPPAPSMQGSMPPPAPQGYAPVPGPFGPQGSVGYAPVPGPFGPQGGGVAQGGALPGTPGWQYTPAPPGSSPKTSSRGGVIVAVALVAFGLPVLAGGVYLATRSNCAEAQHDSHGHCCNEGREWDVSRGACVGGAVATTATDAGVPVIAQPTVPQPTVPQPTVPQPVVPQPTIAPIAAPNPPSAPSAQPDPQPDEPGPDPCAGQWAGPISENTGSRGSISLQVTGTEGTCARWSEQWFNSGARCQYALTRCVATGDGTLRGVGVSSSSGCTSPVQASLRCDGNGARFREAVPGTGVVDVARLSRQ